MTQESRSATGDVNASLKLCRVLNTIRKLSQARMIEVAKLPDTNTGSFFQQVSISCLQFDLFE